MIFSRNVIAATPSIVPIVTPSGMVWEGDQERTIPEALAYAKERVQKKNCYLHFDDLFTATRFAEWLAALPDPWSIAPEEIRCLRCGPHIGLMDEVDWRLADPAAIAAVVIVSRALTDLLEPLGYEPVPGRPETWLRFNYEKAQQIREKYMETAR